MKRCPKCNAQYPDDAQFCPNEGSQLVAVAGEAATSQLIGDHYRLGKVLGGHRTGTVYEAVDERDSSPCVIKLVDPKIFPSPLLMSRAERELKQMSTLKSEHVVSVLNYGKHKSSLWIAMKRVMAEPLSKRLDGKRFSEFEVVALAKQIGRALEDAAKSGLVHRDLSPKNILIGNGDHVQIINFGIPVPGETCSGIAEYLSPEQAKGRPADLRSNIYNIGAILFHCLEGKALYEGTREDVLKSHKEQKTPAMTPEISDSLKNAITKSLEKTSSRRFMTLRQFIEALEPKASSPVSEIAMSTNQGKPKSQASKTLMGMPAPSAANIKAAIEKKKAEEANAADTIVATGTPIPQENAVNVAGRAPARTSVPPPHPKTKQAVEVKPEPEPEPTETVKDLASSKDVVAPVATEVKSAAKIENAAPKPNIASEPIKAASAPAAAAAAAVATLAAPKIAKTPAPKADVSAPIVGKAVGGKGKGSAPVEPQQSSGDKKGKFRETMWFKKGELDEAAAQAAEQKRKKDELASDKADEMAMDVRYNDDGSITEQDQERLSLRTGSTIVEEPVQNVINSGNVSEAELMSEIRGGRGKIFLGLGVGAVLLIVAAFLLI